MRKILAAVMAALFMLSTFAYAGNLSRVWPPTGTHGIKSGEQVKSIYLNDEFDNLINGHNAQETRLNADDTSISNHESRIGTLETTSSTNESRFSSGILSVLHGGTGASTAATARASLGAASNGANTDITSLTGLTTPLSTSQGGTGQNTYTDGQLLIGNTATSQLTKATLTAGTGISITNGNGSITVASTVTANGYPTGFRGSAVPVYVSSSSYTQAYLRERSADDTVNLTKSGSTTVSTGSTGLNGIAQSANLTGTVSVTASSTTVTFSSSQAGVLQVGDVICTAGAQCRRLASGSGTSWVSESAFTSTESTVTVKRGGKAPNTFYYEYIISDGTTPGTILSTRNVSGGDTLVDLPSGYSTTTARQEAFALRLDSSSNILPFYIGGGWPYRPSIKYLGNDLFNSPYLILSAGAATTFTSVSASSLIPPISLEGIFQNNKNTTGTVYFRPAGSSYTSNLNWNMIDNSGTPEWTMQTNSSQAIEYKVSAGTTYVGVRGYIVTEAN